MGIGRAAADKQPPAGGAGLAQEGFGMGQQGHGVIDRKQRQVGGLQIGQRHIGQHVAIEIGVGQAENGAKRLP